MTGVPEFDAFESAAQSLVDVVDRVGPEDWDGPGLGDWDLRSLVGHAGRALTTVTAYVDQPAASEDAESPAEYFAIVSRLSAATGADVVATSVLERGREAGQALGDDPAAAIASLAEKALGRLRGQEDLLMSTPVGGMLLSAYLPTRTFELAVHSLDVAAAVGVILELDPVVLSDSLAIAAEVAARTGQGVPLLMAVTGRTPLPEGFSVV
jgi:uncharacterized protein (TIGR03083 family)